MNHMDERNRTGSAFRNAENQARIDEYDQGLFLHLGIDTANLTQNQVDTILIPSHAPENYMCDGEITSKQAETRWFKQLVQSGLKTKDVARAMKLVR